MSEGDFVSRKVRIMFICYSEDARTPVFHVIPHWNDPTDLCSAGPGVFNCCLILIQRSPTEAWKSLSGCRRSRQTDAIKTNRSFKSCNQSCKGATEPEPASTDGSEAAPAGQPGTAVPSCMQITQAQSNIDFQYAPFPITII